MNRWQEMTMVEMTAVAMSELALDKLAATWRKSSEQRGGRFLFDHYTRPAPTRRAVPACSENGAVMKIGMDDVRDARAAVKVLRTKLDEAYSAEQAAPSGSSGSGRGYRAHECDREGGEVVTRYCPAHAVRFSNQDCLDCLEARREADKCLGTPRCHGQAPDEHVPACPLFNGGLSARS